MASADDRDENLMALVARDQSRWLEPLIRRHANALLTFLERMVGDRHRSEDLFQDVFLAVWSKRRQYEYPRPFKPWLYAIALNKCRAAFRTRRPPPQSLTDSEAIVGRDNLPADRLEAAEVADQVQDAVSALPPQQRAVVALRIWEGLPYAKIAEILECPEGTVRSHMHHGLAALRRSLEPLVASTLV